jgi:hypothetical protein
MKTQAGKKEEEKTLSQIRSQLRGSGYRN